MKVFEQTWAEELPATIMICNSEGIILAMNNAAERMYAEDGGRKLIGSNVLDCHPDPARGKLERMLKKQKANIYTVEEEGRQSLFYQTPWYKSGEYAGFIEFSIEIPSEIPHLVRE